MMRVVTGIVAVVVLLAVGAYTYFMHTASGQDLLLSRALGAMLGQGDSEPVDGISIYVCGSAAPMPAEGREQACLVVLTPEHYFIVDAGAGSANNIGLAPSLPGARLDGILLTHFHSDHISALHDINLLSWVAGRQGPLNVYGPQGVETVVSGFNFAYQLDRHYRTAHHGEDFMPKAFGELKAVLFPMESVLEFGKLTVTSFAADHSPIHPAVGYRFDYKGRSVVITGDTLVTERVREVVAEADLLLADALSLPIVQALETAAGGTRVANILHDIQDYHASVADISELTRSSGVRMTGLYHMVPAPRNALMENIFKRELEDNMFLTDDRMWITLPAGSDQILVD